MSLLNSDKSGVHTKVAWYLFFLARDASMFAPLNETKQINFWKNFKKNNEKQKRNRDGEAFLTIVQRR